MRSRTSHVCLDGSTLDRTPLSRYGTGSECSATTVCRPSRDGEIGRTRSRKDRRANVSFTVFKPRVVCAYAVQTVPQSPSSPYLYLSTAACSMVYNISLYRHDRFLLHMPHIMRLLFPRVPSTRRGGQAFTSPSACKPKFALGEELSI